jgi:hypothetical protein
MPTGTVTAKPVPAPTTQTITEDVVKKEAEEIAKASGQETVDEAAPPVSPVSVVPEDESVKAKE